MTREARNDVIICALLISLALHAGGMFWARPKVMTTVAAGIARVARRGPMLAEISPQALPEPVRIDVVKDVAPESNAPEVAPTVTVAPIADSDEPPTAASLKLPEQEVPEVLERLSPGDAAMPLAPVADRQKAPDDVRMDVSDTVAMANPGPVDTFALSPISDLPAAPSISAEPVPDAEAPPPVEEPQKIEDDGKDGGEKPFEPIPEVMPEVDEKAVEREKEAVRELVDVHDAGELTPFVTCELSAAVDSGWTYFRLRIVPKKDLKHVSKDVVLVLDASGSIGKERMRSIRGAAKRILRSAMNSGDRFNLVAFRDRFSYAFRRWQECTASSFSAADGWLDDIAPHGRTDVFSSIASVLTLPRDPTRPLIALVVTDGDANAGVSDSAEIVSRFSALNDGLVSVYMYGVKASANRELIDALTRANRGESFVFEGWRWLAGSKLEELSRRFRDPVLSDTKIVFSSATKADAYPRRLRNMYVGEALEVTGRVPAGVEEIAFSLRGLNGAKAYEGFFRLPLSSASADPGVVESWRVEKAIDARLN